MKTSKETSELVEKAIIEIKSNKRITETIISETCHKYDLSETHIRNVAGWPIGWYRK